MDKNKKLQDLKDKRDKYKLKLTNMYKNFRGVKHENSLSELRFSEIRVYEDLLRSVEEEIQNFRS